MNAQTDTIETRARELYDMIEAALPVDLNVEGEINRDGDIDHCRPELDRAFDIIDMVLEAMRTYEQAVVA